MWNKLHKAATKSKFRVKRSVSRKLQRKISRQKEAVMRWLRQTNAVTFVLDEVSDFDEEWCDECFVRNCKALPRERERVSEREREIGETCVKEELRWG
jgi:hypothetical protein